MFSSFVLFFSVSRRVKEEKRRREKNWRETVVEERKENGGKVKEGKQ